MVFKFLTETLHGLFAKLFLCVDETIAAFDTGLEIIITVSVSKLVVTHCSALKSHTSKG